MWYNDLEAGKPWSALWHNYILCACGGIRSLQGACPACGAELTARSPLTVRTDDGRELTVSADVYPGAEGRYEDYVYLEMLEREWNRAVIDADRLRVFDPTRQPSPRAAIVLQFWSYFETRVERLLRASMRNLPSRIAEDLLTRYSAIGARLDRLYNILFEKTYRADLNDLGFCGVAQHLARVQDRRNAFSHGDPRAIDDELVSAVVENLKLEHEAWIAVFNRRSVRV